MTAREFNFDGLVGPSHNYAGLSFGNVASFSNVKSASNPKQAALQGLAKMRALAARGFAQALLPPQDRPNFRLLRSLGFSGSDADVLASAYRESPVILACAYSASPMWTANAATVSPSADTADGKVHFTAANLNNKLHRAFEHGQSVRSLRAIFGDERYFAVHDALPSTPAFGDEGAANHTRLCAAHGAAAVEMFVYGRVEFDPSAPSPKRYPARQTLEASQAVARLHGLHPKRTVYLQQNPDVIDQGVFHNDVIAVGNGNVLFYHEQAFAEEGESLSVLRRSLAASGAQLHALRVETGQVPIADAVSSYLFNSQLLSKPDGKMALVIPQECQENRAVARYLDGLVASGGPVDELIHFDLRQSMRNGGGPACLRLRVALTDAEAGAMHQGVLMTEALYQRLVAWVEKHYRDRLEPGDLADPALALEVHAALEELTIILNMTGLYEF
ncbi:N-succinylarginine dihydrolase [Janthinobacterium agaricidamnosum]|uniref:N-succinylarginine dihydrolase n=1 Tax=Janthinobacterium agaricidamnosum NBRC 102515 = DSM 9628 TaxID=1349767 RepID=W0V120_9BURK|nr:N-succinylarginine dihydrolase [Janthinobacterium agaricidamnosum]CDG80972.1 succinylarginine dihydrolase [Janthinobacterium agaricidamnosum NBRC 102515 = DSM 9628]